MTLRLGNYAGLDRVVELLTNAGFSKPAERTPQIFIGNLGGNPRQLTSAISIFPNQGLRRRPYLIDRIVDTAGNVISQTPVLDAAHSFPGAGARHGGIPT